jgi:hypothetical protein
MANLRVAAIPSRSKAACKAHGCLPKPRSAFLVSCPTDNESALLKEAMTVTSFTPSCDFCHKLSLRKRLKATFVQGIRPELSWAVEGLFRCPVSSYAIF